jgi:hypothetical protein
VKSFAIAVVISVGFLALSVVAIRKKQLRDQAAVLWIGVSIFMVLSSFALPIHLLDRIAHGIGIAYASDLLFLIAVIFLVLLVFHLSVSLASIKSSQTRLVQEIALLRAAAPKVSEPRTTEESDLNHDVVNRQASDRMVDSRLLRVTASREDAERTGPSP